MQKNFDAFLVYSYLPLLPIIYQPFIYIYDKTITFGRGNKSDIEFFSKSTSREHSTITIVINEKGHKEYFLEDSDTLNGTFINSVRVESKTKLKHNDRIRFGSSSSEIRYTFKINSKLSLENINIFKFLKTLETDKEKLKSHPLSKLFTPLLIASSAPSQSNEETDNDSTLLDENNHNNNNNNNLNNDNNSTKKKKLDNEKIKKLQVNETPLNKTTNSSSNKSTIKKTTPKTINKKRKHEEIHNKDKEDAEEKSQKKEEEKEEEKEEKTEIFEKDSLVQFILADKTCEIGTVISYNKNKNSYSIQSESNKRYQIKNGEVEKAWIKRLEFESVKIKSRVRVFHNEKWYRGIILEKRCNTGGRLKYEYLVRLIDIKQPHIWIGGLKILKE
ncbi:hypothetical protein ACTFIU_001341 [Dictyostelium citrinum]